MERADLWYFSKERLERTPSRENGIEAEKELSLRQQAANFIQDIGQCLAVSQLCINTAIVYMHRFYMFHSFTKFHRFKIAACAMFLAAKVEEQPRKMEHVLKISHICLHKNDPPLDVTSPAYLEKQAELVSNENIMLQTLGFVIGIDHPHTYIVKLCQLVKASKDLAQTSYFMATNSLHLTTMCLQYKPTVVACVCIHLACKWADWKIAPCSEGKEWYYYVDKTVTLELLEELTNEFVKILKEYPNKIRRKVSFANGKEPSAADRRKLEQTIGCIERVMEPRPEQSSDTNQPKKRSSPESSSLIYLDAKDDFPSTSSLLNCTEYGSAENSPSKKSKSETSSSVSITLADYREKRDKGRLEKKNAHLEIPSSSQRQNAVVDKHSRPLVNHEKPQHSMPYTKPEFAMQRVVEKSNKPSSEFNPSPVDKFNHQSARLPTVNESHHQESKFIAPVKSAPEIKTESQGNKADHPSRETNKDILPHPDSTESFSSNILPAPPCPNDVEQSVTVRLPHEKRTHNLGPERTNQKLPDISLHNKVNKVKHPKHKPASQSPLPRNSHGEPLSVSQDNGVLKQSSDWDSAKSCSSKREPCVVIEHKAVAAATAAAAEQIRVPEKTPEPPVKHERKERHKHKHSVHSSSKEKSSRNREPPPPDQNICGGLKITIPKDKIVLSGVRPDSSQKSNLGKPEDKRCLKIKLPKPKIACSDTPQPPLGLKLVLTKDKNAGSYSASHKPDKVSRKRDHSPKDHSSKNSESGKPSKVAKLEESQKSFHQEGYHAASTLPPEQKISRHFHHGEVNQFNVSAGSKKNPGRGYRHLNDSSIAPTQYVMPYGSGGQPYYQQYSQPQTNISGSGYQNKMVHVSYDHTKLPPPPPDVPPLPKDPPPPLPPQPPPEY